MLAWIGLPRLIGLGTLGLVALFAYSAVESVIDRYTGMSGQIEALSHENGLLKARLESYNLRISRRDAAIEQSKCSAQIKYWISHPDALPTPFKPFDNLNSGS